MEKFIFSRFAHENADKYNEKANKLLNLLYRLRHINEKIKTLLYLQDLPDENDSIYIKEFNIVCLNNIDDLPEAVNFNIEQKKELVKYTLTLLFMERNNIYEVLENINNFKQQQDES